MIYYRVLFGNIFFSTGQKISRQDPYQAGTVIMGLLNPDPQFNGPADPGLKELFTDQQQCLKLAEMLECFRMAFPFILLLS
jgi:hypothetical protein